MIVYGDDACPPSTDDTIVVCARKPEGERYRIPEVLRGDPNDPKNQAWASARPLSNMPAAPASAAARRSARAAPAAASTRSSARPGPSAAATRRSTGTPSSRRPAASGSARSTSRPKPRKPTPAPKRPPTPADRHPASRDKEGRSLFSSPQIGTVPLFPPFEKGECRGEGTCGRFGPSSRQSPKGGRE